MDSGRRTTISNKLAEVIEPFVEPLERARESISMAAENRGLQDVLPRLWDAASGLRSLHERLEKQQPFLLILGPLKSGKSTLMNAVTGTYVSEVTALPAYPCLVHVAYGERVEFLITRYGGETESFADAELLRERIEIAHRDLVARMRDVESRGIEFDPRAHAPDAILRVDVRVPAEGLRKRGGMAGTPEPVAEDDTGDAAGPVLIDTPGLYSRMRFAYDRLARDARNTAACAVFVVKTDNLFLESVFDEFDEILELFSRIFLIVNIDSSKRDVSPDGSLVPSLEQRDPQKIIEAFRNLAMSRTLREAALDDRLRIYPIDLLAAASFRLGGRSDVGGWDGGARASEDDHMLSGFDLFRQDLEQYLGSDEYLDTFLVDNVRYAQRMLDDVARIGRHDSLRGLVGELVELQDGIAEERELSEAFGRLERTDWPRVLSSLAEPVNRGLERRRDEIARRAGDRALDLVRGWFEGGASLTSLFHEGVVAVIEESQQEIAATLLEIIRSVFASGGTGFAMATDIEEDLQQVGIRLTSIGRSCFDGADPLLGVCRWTPPIPYDDIPVRSWVGGRAKRQRLFGPPEAPDRAIMASEKSRRLGNPAREVLLSAIDTCLQRALSDTIKSQAEATLADFTYRIECQLRERIETELEACGRRTALLTDRCAEVTRLHRDTQVLRKLASTGSEALKPLLEECAVPPAAAETDPEEPVIDGGPRASRVQPAEAPLMEWTASGWSPRRADSAPAGRSERSAEAEARSWPPTRRGRDERAESRDS